MIRSALELLVDTRPADCRTRFSRIRWTRSARCKPWQTKKKAGCTNGDHTSKQNFKNGSFPAKVNDGKNELCIMYRKMLGEIQIAECT